MGILSCCSYDPVVLINKGYSVGTKKSARAWLMVKYLKEKDCLIKFNEKLPKFAIPFCMSECLVLILSSGLWWQHAKVLFGSENIKNYMC